MVRLGIIDTQVRGSKTTQTQKIFVVNFIFVIFNISVDYSVCRMEYNMTDSELAALFDDLTEALGPNYIEAPTIAAAHGKPILLYHVCLYVVDVTNFLRFTSF